MATHYTITPTANIFGTLGAVCWSVQLLPQIILNYRNRSTAGLEPKFMLLWASAGCPLAVYNTVNGFNVALVVQPQLLTVLSLITWCQCQIYGNGGDSISRESSTTKRILRLLRRLLPLLLLLAALETALILLCRLALRHGHLWPTTACGVLSGVLLCAGVGCEYYGIWKSRSVQGISFLFCGIDAAGDVCSGISVLTQSPHDYVALGIYLAEFIFWAGIFACGGYYRFLPWLLSKSSILQRLRQRTEVVFGHRHSPDHSGAADDSSEHRGDDVEMPVQAHHTVRNPEVVGDAAGTSVTSARIEASQAGMVDGLRTFGNAEPMVEAEEAMTLSVFRTASSATTDTMASRRRRQGVRGASSEVDVEVV